MNKIIFFELNEVPQKIIEYYCRVRPNSWIALNYSTFHKFNSYSENKDHLNPWNTWPTLHRGVDSSQHKILDLNQDLSEQNKHFPALWEILSKNNISTGVFGSLHAKPSDLENQNYDFFVPDVFSQTNGCIPKKIEIFQHVNLNLSRKSSRNVSNSLPKKDILNLAVHSRSLGIKTQTINSITKQLIDEKRENWKNTRRRTLQSVISFDIFYKQLKRHKSAFVTFHTNHVASCLHRYWAAAFPGEYDVNNFPDEWINRYDGEILYALDAADKMLNRLAGFVNNNPDYKLLILSSMGQDAVKANPIKTQLYVNDFKKFISHYQLKHEVEVLPAMRPQFNFRVNGEDVRGFKNLADKTMINGKPLRYREHNAGHFSIEMGHINQNEIVFTIADSIIAEIDSGLKNVRISDLSSTTADHIPEGILYIYHPTFKTSQISTSVVETCSIFPTILDNFGLKNPSYSTAKNKHILS